MVTKARRHTMGISYGLQDTNWKHPYRMLYGKACHLPFEFEYKALWALKKVHLNDITSGRERLIKLHELEELRSLAYENSRIYKEQRKKWHDAQLKEVKVFKEGDKRPWPLSSAEPQTTGPTAGCPKAEPRRWWWLFGLRKRKPHHRMVVAAIAIDNQNNHQPAVVADAAVVGGGGSGVWIVEKRAAVVADATAAAVDWYLHHKRPRW
ncbi:hypothetical protein OSB04_016815 [Centaurea solstitialis]|uniref:Uncharacterized protein n=1 Tax=Centaurea solstitialis TaxID=347529 RepID=A0AA38WHT8_9ASTR|nr:hypothetical protein OSB04_016815 [Centaurea solstitialis]